MGHGLFGALVASTAEELRHLVLERLLQDQPRAEAADRIQGILIAADTGQHFSELSAKPLARGYSRHAAYLHSLRLVGQSGGYARSFISPGS